MILILYRSGEKSVKRKNGTDPFDMKYIETYSMQISQNSSILI